MADGPLGAVCGAHGAARGERLAVAEDCCVVGSTVVVAAMAIDDESSAAWLRLVTENGEAHDFVLGVGQYATLTVKRRWRSATYRVELVSTGHVVEPES